MDPSAVVGVAGALAGVALGGWLSWRQQLTVQRLTRQQSERDAKRVAYVEFLATVRRFRRFILTSSVEVTLRDQVANPVVPVAIVLGADDYWDALEHATSQLWIVSGHASTVGEAARQLTDAFYEVARARATHEPQRVPPEVVEASRQAERRFADAARADLGVL